MLVIGLVKNCGRGRVALRPRHQNPDRVNIETMRDLATPLAPTFPGREVRKANRATKKAIRQKGRAEMKEAKAEMKGQRKQGRYVKKTYGK